jgi:hypothetical protein
MGAAGFSLGLSATLSQTQSAFLLAGAGDFSKGLAHANRPALMSKTKLDR